MTREKILNSIGIALLALCFVISLLRVFSRSKREADVNHVQIRFAHWQLEAGVRGAYAELAKEYEALHPGVTVEPMAIPEQIAKNWCRTQLVGGSAPDIIELGGVMGIDDESLARYFTPLTAAVDQPNPYNVGTDMAAEPWRETFVDGLSSAMNYSEGLLEYYGVSSSMFTIRVYYNRDLWKKIVGSDAVPKSYEDFVEVCRKAAAYEPKDGHRVIPIAGSKYNAPFVMNDLFSGQTQRLRQKLGPFHNLGTSDMDVSLSYLDGEWTWKTPAVQSGLDLMMRVGKFMQPGFLSLGRDDALFYFAQGSALMIATGSWDSTSIRVQVPFDIGVFRIPLPTRTDPKYGKYLFGQTSEAGTDTGLTFGITSASKHGDVALDFLRFLTSKKSNGTFSRLSGWLPSVVGVAVPKTIAEFAPDTEGYVGGFGVATGVGTDVARISNNNMYLLVGPTGSVDRYTDAMADQYGGAVKSDLRRFYKSKVQNSSAKDSAIGAYQMLRPGDADSGATDTKIEELFEAQDQQEGDLYYMDWSLKKLGIKH